MASVMKNNGKKMKCIEKWRNDSINVKALAYGVMAEINGETQ
jgi:hypothetical protein